MRRQSFSHNNAVVPPACPVLRKETGEGGKGSWLRQPFILFFFSLWQCSARGGARAERWKGGGLRRAVAPLRLGGAHTLLIRKKKGFEKGGVEWHLHHGSVFIVARQAGLLCWGTGLLCAPLAMLFTCLAHQGSSFHQDTVRFVLVKSLCGKYPCPGVCSRVCHCEAGGARVRWLWFYRKSLKEVSETRPSETRPCPEGVDPVTGEISEARPYQKTARYRVMQAIDQAWPRDPDPRHMTFGKTALTFTALVLPKHQGSRKARLIVGILLAVFTLAAIICSFSSDLYEPSGPEIGEVIDHRANFWKNHWN